MVCNPVGEPIGLAASEESDVRYPSPTIVSEGDVGEEAAAKHSFLVIDDSAVIRRRLVSLLSETDGVQLVGEAEDAATGAELIRKLHPDVVILDIRMPDRSGISVLEEIKNDPKVPTIIILTNYPYAAYKKRCMELGASHFFDKSTEFVELEKVVRNLARV